MIDHYIILYFTILLNLIGNPGRLISTINGLLHKSSFVSIYIGTKGLLLSSPRIILLSQCTLYLFLALFI